MVNTRLKHRMVTPSYNTGMVNTKLKHRKVSHSYNTRIVNKRLKHRNGCPIEKVNNKTHTYMHTINRK